MDNNADEPQHAVNMLTCNPLNTTQKTLNSAQANPFNKVLWYEVHLVFILALTMMMMVMTKMMMTMTMMMVMLMTIMMMMTMMMMTRMMVTMTCW